VTIKRGQPWGERRIPPANLPVATSDRQAAKLLSEGCQEFLLTGGDMFRTLGGAPASSLDLERTVVTVDTMLVSYCQVETGLRHQYPVFSHAVFTERCWPRWLRRFQLLINRLRPADETFIMNTQFLGSWDVIPRGHPNDGRLDILTVPASLSWRQRWQFRRRIQTGTHVPHPLIEVRPITQTWSADGCGTLTLDGLKRGPVEDLTISVVSDSVTVWF
jgi:hypothetical protein